jgi:hypothetical protein
MKEVKRWVMSFIEDRRAKRDCRGDDLISKLLATDADTTYLTRRRGGDDVPWLRSR